MGDLLANEFAIPAGGIAGALAIIIVTLIKVRAQGRESQNAWVKEHMGILAQERREADERADKFLAELDAERQLRVAAEAKASRLEGKEEILREQLSAAEAEIARLRAQLGPLGI